MQIKPETITALRSFFLKFRKKYPHAQRFDFNQFILEMIRELEVRFHFREDPGAR